MTAQGQFGVDWYKKHYGGQVPVLDSCSPEENARFVAPGSRYWLAAARIQELAKADDLLVETGCGDARLLFEITRRSGIARAIGLDAAFAQERKIGPVLLKSHNLNETWPFESGSVNFLMGMMIYEHLFDPFHSFSEVKRCLAPNGTAFVNLPLVTAIPNRWRLLTGNLPITSGPVERWFQRKEWDGGHLHYFSMSSIRRLAASCGLRVTEIAGVGAYHRLKSALPDWLASEVTFSLRHESARDA
jgi:hypothetical protein